MLRRWRWPGPAAAAVVSALVAASASCTSTVDSVGYNGMAGVHLKPVTGPMTYPNPFGDLGKSDADIAAKIAQVFMQLFYGDPNTAAIYFPIGTDQANIQDVYHNHEVRTEGIGLAMMITVELDKRMEFDRLWTYATEVLEYKDGARRGYFQSTCDMASGATQVCDDPYGEAQMVTALIFANDRWGSTTGAINYEAGAVALLDVMRHKQDENGGIVDGITNVFDSESGLPFDVPVAWVAAAQWGRPSIVMPAYYDLWAQATGDPFWSRASAVSRAYWQKVAYPTTGLMPVRATFSGGVVPDWNSFQPESYRAQFNMALDQIWSQAGAASQTDDWNVEEANRLLKFFSRVGINAYGKSYTLDGTPIDGTREYGLVAANGVTAMIATNLDRADYVNQVWELMPPIGQPRYYAGILDLTALLILGGQYRVL